MSNTQIDNVLNNFEKNQRNLINTLDDINTKNANKRKEILENFTLNKKAFKNYYNEVYKNANENEIGSCNDVLGPENYNSLFGLLDNISANLNTMTDLSQEVGFYEFDDRANILRIDRGRNRFALVKNSINHLHSNNDKYSPNIPEPTSKKQVFSNLNSLENMLKSISELQ